MLVDPRYEFIPANVTVILPTPAVVTITPEFPDITPFTLIVLPAPFIAIKITFAKFALIFPAITLPELSTRNAPISLPEPVPVALFTIILLLMVAAPTK